MSAKQVKPQAITTSLSECNKFEFFTIASHSYPDIKLTFHCKWQSFTRPFASSDKRLAGVRRVVCETSDQFSVPH